MRTATGRILVQVPAGVGRAGRTVLYARVSSHDQRAVLDRQVARLTQGATGQQMSGEEVVVEVGSAMNAKRAKLARVLADGSATTVVVEHRDRLAGFGLEHLAAALSAQGRRIVAVDPDEVDDDLVRDMPEVLTWFGARLDGRHGARSRAVKALGCAQNDVGPAAL